MRHILHLAECYTHSIFNCCCSPTADKRFDSDGHKKEVSGPYCVVGDVIKLDEIDTGLGSSILALCFILRAVEDIPI
jgi:hypothetical protein